MITGISDRAVFATIRAEGQHVRTGDLRLRYLLVAEGDSDPPVPQLAYAISRKVGNAVVRNRIRRRLRAVFLHNVGEYPGVLSAGVVIVLPGARERNYAELQEQVSMLMKKIEKSTETTP